MRHRLARLRCATLLGAATLASCQPAPDATAAIPAPAAPGIEQAAPVAPEIEQAAVDTPALPPGVSAFRGHHYLLVDDVKDLTWPMAKKQCEEWGAHLAVVTDIDEADFIATLCDGRYMFLGASDDETEGVWRWVDGSPWEFTHWLKGQPNDYTGAENYLATYDKGQWVDVDIGGEDFWMPTGYICEWAR